MRLVLLVVFLAILFLVEFNIVVESQYYSPIRATLYCNSVRSDRTTSSTKFHYYRLIVTSSKYYRISLCNSPSHWDSELYLYRVSSGSSTTVTSNDDGCPSGSNTLHAYTSSRYLSSSSLFNYYIKVQGRFSSSYGSYRLKVCCGTSSYAAGSGCISSSDGDSSSVDAGAVAGWVIFAVCITGYIVAGVVICQHQKRRRYGASSAVVVKPAVVAVNKTTTVTTTTAAAAAPAATNTNIPYTAVTQPQTSQQVQMQPMQVQMQVQGQGQGQQQYYVVQPQAVQQGQQVKYVYQPQMQQQTIQVQQPQSQAIQSNIVPSDGQPQQRIIYVQQPVQQAPPQYEEKATEEQQLNNDQNEAPPSYAMDGNTTNM